MGCGYLPTGYLPTGYLPMSAAATRGGSLRGKSAAAATLSMATSPAVTITMVFMMLIPLCWAPGRADRVTPLFRFVCARRPLLPSHVPAQSPGGMAPEYMSPRPVEWFKYNRQDQDSGICIGPGATYARSAPARSVLERHGSVDISISGRRGGFGGDRSACVASVVL